jgi:hypothetical protein
LSAPSYWIQHDGIGTDIEASQFGEPVRRASSASQFGDAQACRGEQFADRDIANRAVLVDRPEQAPKLARAQRDPSRRIDRRDGDVHHRGGANQGGRLSPSEEDHKAAAAAL